MTPLSSVTVEAGDLFFRPAELAIPASGSTRLVLVDIGRVLHNLTVDELGVQLITSPGMSAEMILVDPAPGTYEFYCSVSGHREAGMVGTLIIE